MRVFIFRGFFLFVIGAERLIATGGGGAPLFLMKHGRLLTTGNGKCESGKRRTTLRIIVWNREVFGLLQGEEGTRGGFEKRESWHRRFSDWRWRTLRVSSSVVFPGVFPVSFGGVIRTPLLITSKKKTNIISLFCCMYECAPPTHPTRIISIKFSTFLVQVQPEVVATFKLEMRNGFYLWIQLQNFIS